MCTKFFRQEWFYVFLGNTVFYFNSPVCLCLCLSLHLRLWFIPAEVVLCSWWDVKIQEPPAVSFCPKYTLFGKLLSCELLSSEPSSYTKPSIVEGPKSTQKINTLRPIFSTNPWSSSKHSHEHYHSDQVSESRVWCHAMSQPFQGSLSCLHPNPLLDSVHNPVSCYRKPVEWTNEIALSGI